MTYRLAMWRPNGAREEREWGKEGESEQTTDALVSSDRHDDRDSASVPSVNSGHCGRAHRHTNAFVVISLHCAHCLLWPRLCARTALTSILVARISGDNRTLANYYLIYFMR